MIFKSPANQNARHTSLTVYRKGLGFSGPAVCRCLSILIGGLVAKQLIYSSVERLQLDCLAQILLSLSTTVADLSEKGRRRWLRLQLPVESPVLDTDSSARRANPNNSKKYDDFIAVLVNLFID